jgi:hypothetical protein
MRAHKIPSPLSKAVLDYLIMLIEDQKANVDEDKVDLLKDLSAELNGDLKRAIFQPRVQGFFPISKLLKDRGEGAIALSRLIATKACKLIRVLKQQQLFEGKQTGLGMYFLTSGVFNLTTADSIPFIIGPDSEDPNFPPGGHVVKWLCEFAVVMPWLHKDRVVACVNGELVLIERVAFLECLDTDPARKQAFLEDNTKRFDRTLARDNGQVGDWSDQKVILDIQRSLSMSPKTLARKRANSEGNRFELEGASSLRSEPLNDDEMAALSARRTSKTPTIRSH